MVRQKDFDFELLSPIGWYYKQAPEINVQSIQS